MNEDEGCEGRQTMQEEMNTNYRQEGQQNTQEPTTPPTARTTVNNGNDGNSEYSPSDQKKRRFIFK